MLFYFFPGKSKLFISMGISFDLAAVLDGASVKQKTRILMCFFVCVFMFMCMFSLSPFVRGLSEGFLFKCASGEADARRYAQHQNNSDDDIQTRLIVIHVPQR